MRVVPTKERTTAGTLVSSVSPKGQVTLPIEIRRLLGIKPKDKVAFSVDQGEVRIIPVRYSLESLVGSVEPPTATEQFESIIEAAKDERAERLGARLVE
jgi:antitoxin PrlF